MKFVSTTWRKLALVSYLSLFAWVISWHGWLSPHEQLSRYFLLALWVPPLLFPLKGILQGKPYTHAWANFVLMLYFMHAFTILWIDEGERWLAVIELILVSSSFVSNTYFARAKGKELGSRLPKLSEVEKAEKARFQHESK
ncbi:DUF2069 domain-containing protein [Thaumasiovibrio subtropicus]|uniref:DUF2069 domain-containing protein n=1 Tax=Thaumasiovibrio subtropicus TaxID=1891207 RepID=UPI000B35665C|nr:DUF2069 domain-containing protein [Thaumasiovibrio subtropicus]